MTLANLNATIQTLVRDTNTASPIFAAGEYTSAIDQAVRQYSIDKKRYLPFNLNLLAGQNKYTLPTDWIAADLEAFQEQLQNNENIDYFDYSGFVLPSLNGPDTSLNELEYTWYDAEQFLLVNPAPTSNATLNFAYFALHQANNTVYSIPIMDESAVGNLAASILLDVLAVDRGTKMQKYKIGQGLDIDDSTVAVRLQELAKTYRANYSRMVHRPIGVMG